MVALSETLLAYLDRDENTRKADVSQWFGGILPAFRGIYLRASTLFYTLVLNAGSYSHNTKLVSSILLKHSHDVKNLETLTLRRPLTSSEREQLRNARGIVEAGASALLHLIEKDVEQHALRKEYNVALEDLERMKKVACSLGLSSFHEALNEMIQDIKDARHAPPASWEFEQERLLESMPDAKQKGGVIGVGWCGLVHPDHIVFNHHRPVRMLKGLPEKVSDHEIHAAVAKASNYNYLLRDHRPLFTNTIQSGLKSAGMH